MLTSSLLASSNVEAGNAKQTNKEEEEEWWGGGGGGATCGKLRQTARLRQQMWT